MGVSGFIGWGSAAAARCSTEAISPIAVREIAATSWRAATRRVRGDDRPCIDICAIRDYSASIPSPQPAPPGNAVSPEFRHQKSAWFQKGLATEGLTGVRPGTPKLGLWRAIVSGRFAWRDDVWRRKYHIVQCVDPDVRFAGSIFPWRITRKRRGASTVVFYWWSLT